MNIVDDDLMDMILWYLITDVFEEDKKQLVTEEIIWSNNKGEKE